MNRFNLLIFVMFMVTMVSMAQIKIGDNPQTIDPSSLLELESNSRVLVISKVSSTQMETIAPQRGGMVYNTDTECIHYFDGTLWVNLCDAVSFTITNDPIENLRSTIAITQSQGNYNLEVAANSIRTEQIADGGINGVDIQDNSIGRNKLGNAAVGPDELATESVDSDAIIDGTIQPRDFASSLPNRVLTTDINGAVLWQNQVNLFELSFDKDTNTLSIVPATGGGSNSINLEALVGSDDQRLTLTADNRLQIENGNEIDLSFLNNAGTDNQTVSTDDTPGNIAILNGNEITLNVNDADAEPDNELQNINEVLTDGNDAGGLSIKNIGTPVDDQDAVTKAYVDGAITGVGGNIVSTQPGNVIVNNAGAFYADPDNDATNEIQDLELTTDILTITNNAAATPIDLKTYLDNTDDQNASEVEVTATPTNYTAGTPDVEAHLAGIDAALAGGGGSTELADQITITGDGTLGNEFTVGTIGSAQITNGAILLEDLGQNGAGDGQVLKWNGVAWAPAADAGGTAYTAGNGLTLNGTAFEVDNLAGDVTGPTSATVIVDNAITTAKIIDGAITADKLNNMGATSDQVLKWNGTAWAPAADAGGTAYTAGNGLTLNGTAFEVDNLVGDVTGPTSATVIVDNAITTAKIADGTILATDLNPMGAANGDVLKWNGFNWEPNTDATGNTVLPGVGLTLNGSAFDVDNLAGDVTGPTSATVIADNAITSSKIADGSILLEDIDQNGATDGQILKWNQGVASWEVANESAAITGTENSIFFGDASGAPITAEQIGLPGNERGLFWNPTSRANTGALFVGLKPSSTYNIATSPSKVVVVERLNSLAYPLQILNESNTLGAAASILFTTNFEGTAIQGKGALAYERTGSRGRGDFHFLQNTAINNNNPTLAESVLTIKNNGNVIIGPNSRNIAATQKLHVEGDLRLTEHFFDETGTQGTPGQVLSSTATGTAWVNAPSSGTAVSDTDANDGLSDFGATTGYDINVDGTTIGLVGDELQLLDNAVTSAKIANATILAEDLSALGATTTGEVLKWNGTTWAAGTDLTGGAVVTDNDANDGLSDFGATTGYDINVDGTTIGLVGDELQLADDAVTSAKITNGTILAEDLSAMGATTNGEVLKWNGSAWTASTDNNSAFTGTTGSIPFSDGTSLIEDNDQLFFDSVNQVLGIGTNNPDNGSGQNNIKLHVSGGRIRAEGILNSDGGPNLPSYRFNSDPNTGMFWGGVADELGFSVGGIEALRIRDEGTTDSEIIAYGSFELTEQLLDENGNTGNVGEILTATSTGTEWKSPQIVAMGKYNPGGSNNLQGAAVSGSAGNYTVTLNNPIVTADYIIQLTVESTYTINFANQTPASFDVIITKTDGSALGSPLPQWFFTISDF